MKMFTKQNAAILGVGFISLAVSTQLMFLIAFIVNQTIL